MADQETIQISPEQDAALDREVDKGSTYRIAREKLGILPLDREVIVVEHPERPVETTETTSEAPKSPVKKYWGNWKNDA